MSGCNCKADWRLEILDLATGARLGWLPFISFDFDDLLNQVGPATVVVPLRKVTLDQIFPHRRAIAFTRTAGPGASPSSPVCEYTGMIEAVSATSDGTLTLGLQSIEYYLNYRIIVSDTELAGFQTTMGAALVNLAVSDGIPLTGTADSVSAHSRDIAYAAADDKVILTAVSELTQLTNGPDYRRTFAFAGGAWSTVLYFADYIGDTDGKPLNSRRGLSQYGVEIDATKHANWLRGRGQDISPVTEDRVSGSLYPRFDKAVQWSDVTQPGVLAAAVSGDLDDNADPTAIPDATVADLNIACRYALGDTVHELSMDDGALRYHGDARVIGKSWHYDPDGPPTCTFSLTPLEGVQSTMLNVAARLGSECC